MGWSLDRFFYRSLGWWRLLSNASQLATLATALCEVRSLTVGENDGMEVVECVGALLDELARCGDVVIGCVG